MTNKPIEIPTDVEIPLPVEDTSKMWESEITLADWNKLVLAMKGEPNAEIVMEFVHENFSSSERTAVIDTLAGLFSGGFPVNSAVQIIKILQDTDFKMYDIAQLLKQLLADKLITPGKGN